MHGLHITDNQVEAGSGEWITVAAVDGGSLNTSAAETHSNVVVGNGETIPKGALRLWPRCLPEQSARFW